MELMNLTPSTYLTD